VVDAYFVVAASVLASNTVFRNMFGAAFPVSEPRFCTDGFTDAVHLFSSQLFGRQMFEELNPQFASTVLGAAAFIVAPLPLFLTKLGPALRKKSRYAMDPMHEISTHRSNADN
jgi:hypothetical protein